MNRTAQPVPPDRTDTARLRVIDGEAVDPTWRIPAPWMRPPVTATYSRPESRLARRARALARSPFARHLGVASRFLARTVLRLAVLTVLVVGAASFVVGFCQLAAVALQTIGVLP